jgi:serine protease AprX
MNKTQKIILNLVVAVLFVSILATAIAPFAPQTTNAHPVLLELADQTPYQQVRVIAQKSGSGDAAEKLVASLGGVIVQDLHIINAFAAELTANSAVKLSQSPALRWVSLDAPMEQSGYLFSESIVRDEFNLVSFSNNDGSDRWLSDWAEHDVSALGPASGLVKIVDGGLSIDDQLGTISYPSAARAVDLSDAVSAVSFSFHFSTGAGVEAFEDRVAVEVSRDGGSTYTILEIIDSPNGAVTESRNYDITSYASANTMIRFRIYDKYGGPEEYFKVDNVQVSYTVAQTETAALENYFLDTLGVRQAWDLGYDGKKVGVVVFDSGITKDDDFGRRVKKQVSLSPDSSTVNDIYGHGTHVAGIVGGDGSDSNGQFMGVAPGVNLYSVKVSDGIGMSYESDAVAGLQWALDYAAKNNIRIVNMSLNSTVEQSYHTSPLNAAIEILWFNGIVVIASAGNVYDGMTYNPILAAPANDPFVITVGASHEQGTTDPADDIMTDFSAYGPTQDGFIKPDIIAPGKDIYSVLSSQSNWAVEHPDRVALDGEYFRLSGTSMSAPIVAGAAALLLQAEPDLTPDQVKYRLMNATNRTLADPTGQSYPYLDVYTALTNITTESANTGIEASQLLWTGEDPVTWDSVSWNSVGWNSVGWNSVGWNSVAWNSVAWNSVAWND